MALNKAIAEFLAKALEIQAIPPGGEVLEIGESAVSFHHKPEELLGVVAPHISERRLSEATRQLEASRRCKAGYQRSLGPARAFYHAVFEPSFYVAIELGVAPRRLCVDLNGSVRTGRLFDYVINNGTSEHVFDQANFFRLIHDSTRLGGLMIHWTPCIGWTNHGLFHAQPGLFYDLAAANDYDILLIGLGGTNVFSPLESADGYRQAIQRQSELINSGTCVLLRKTSDTPFRTPTQGYYQGGPSEQHELSKIPRQYTADSRPNLALRKPAMQSSTGKWSWNDDPALDAAGGNNGMITGYYSFCTDLELDPWWMVDLGTEQHLNEIVVYNRIDGQVNGASRSAHLQISLSDDGESWSKVYSRSDDSLFGGADGKPLRILMHGRPARFIRLGLQGKTILCLDEIEVY
jgi:hypothetical protein